ncbi:MAG: hypothetical protein K8T89_01670, partial [Planctomycetes bacterium]|nr:hypothetical protein [Planctomycetota bacterium]
DELPQPPSLLPKPPVQEPFQAVTITKPKVEPKPVCETKPVCEIKPTCVAKPEADRPARAGIFSGLFRKSDPRPNTPICEPCGKKEAAGKAAVATAEPELAKPVDVAAKEPEMVAPTMVTANKPDTVQPDMGTAKESPMPDATKKDASEMPAGKAVVGTNEPEMPAGKASVGSNEPATGEPKRMPQVASVDPMTMRPVLNDPLSLPTSRNMPGAGYPTVAIEKQRMLEMMETLKHALRPSERMTAAEDLAKGPFSRGADVHDALLLAAQEDPAGIVRATCIRCLSKLGVRDHKFMTLLAESQEDENPDIRDEAKYAMQKVKRQ